MNRALRTFFFAIGLLVLGAMALCSPRAEFQEPTDAILLPPAVEAPVAAPQSAALQPNGAPGAVAPTGANSSVVPPVVPPVVPRESAPKPSGRGFRTPSHLADHFEKHGSEFGASSAAVYLALAQQLRDAPAGGDILEIVRPTDGVISRFDRRTGAFLAVDRDGTIRTFFKPNDGEAYFRRQANRLPNNSGGRL